MSFSKVSPVGPKERMRVAFVSSCLPRKCGIATFSVNLSRALANIIGPDAVSFIALNNNERYDYPPQVICEIEQDNLEGYYHAANLINSSNVDVVSLQHEFGLFGGPDGIYLKMLLKHLKKPVVTTLHTILKNPSPGQKEAFAQTAAHSQALVVMNKLAIDMMTNIYGVPRSKINLIPHGVPEKEYRDPLYYKLQLALQDRLLILTFGFLSPNKGIETMLKALPAVTRKHPDVLYIVLGITHPVEKNHNGEAYRESLEKLVQDMDLHWNVMFIDSFVDDEEMERFVGAADIVVCPYHSKAQITSGVLSTALSKGKAIVSTPYLHARDALAEGRGLLVNSNDPVAMSAAVLRLVNNPQERQTLAEKAYALGRQMGWSNVSKQYLKTFARVKLQAERGRILEADRTPLSPSNRFDYLKGAARRTNNLSKKH